MKRKILISFILALMILCNIKVYATDTADLPSKYDLRNDINIKVENQGTRGWCNVYSYVKMVETYLQKTRGINYDLSEAYVAYSNAPYFGGDDEKLTSASIINDSAVDVSNVISKKALVLESDFPNTDYSFNKTNKTKFDNAKILIKSFREIRFSKSEEVKQYIITNGAVQIHAYGNDKKARQIWQNSNGTINCKKSVDDLEGGHAVTIIGWDDNYSRNNFNSNCRPKNDGAWLILNSWGTSWGNNGTAWVSYEDEWFNHSMQNYLIKGIESITLRGELNAILDYGVVGNSIQARILTDDKIEDIDGWICDNPYTYTKTFTEPFEPYTIELKSKTDEATTTIEINIPDENFKYDNTHQTSVRIGSNKMHLDKQDMILISFLVALAICVVIIIVICFKKAIHRRKSNNEADKKEAKKDKSKELLLK